ncbi:conserved hypothetical protein [Burkholderia pseudomallei MSHR346]|nr:conserved hypothetical protein [Burkholderia pseudomallei MSHR346]
MLTHRRAAGRRAMASCQPFGNPCMSRPTVCSPTPARSVRTPKRTQIYERTPSASGKQSGPAFFMAEPFDSCRERFARIFPDAHHGNEAR